MADTADTPPAAPRTGGLAGLVVALLVTTAVGGGAGAVFGLTQVGDLMALATKRANEAPKTDETALAWDKSTGVAKLDPVITNLASPPGARVRVDGAIVFDVEKVEDVERMKAVVGEDILAFMRTVSMGELVGASAFNHLRDDLNERARAVSAGTVRELMIEGLVLQ
jgi:flagellar protein FliL